MQIVSHANRYQAVPPVNHPQASNPSPASFADALQEAEASDALRGPDGKLKPLFRHSSNGVISLTTLQAERDEVMASYQKSLHDALVAAGIDTRKPIALQSDPSRNGLPMVVNDHPDKAKIEALFEQDLGLTNEFHHVSSLSALIRAGQDASEFQQAYRANPDAALTQYASLFSSQYITTLLLDGGTLGVETERKTA